MGFFDKFKKQKANQEVQSETVQPVKDTADDSSQNTESAEKEVSMGPKIDNKHIEALSDRMKKILQDELDAGNEINETYQGWKYEDSIMVFLKYSFKAPVKTDLPGISYLELNDPHYWKAEYYEEDSHQTIACDFL